LALLSLAIVAECEPAYTFKTSVTDEEMRKCHEGYENDQSPRCHDYKTEISDDNKYPKLPAHCTTIKWKFANETNNWGNCFAMTEDKEFRYIASNNVPDFYNGDVWVPFVGKYKIPLHGNPTRSDRPGDMYDADTVGGEKNIGASTGVAINGIGIRGPNNVGDVESIDEADVQLSCGGHAHSGPTGTPLYHFHKSPECLEPFENASRGEEHGQLIGWAMDGFKIFSDQDVEGAEPIVDQCGGHFGPTDTGQIEYHYHSRDFAPYHLACQGPSLGNCKDTQGGTNFCHTGCGAEVCVQPGTREKDLRTYLDQWDTQWLDKYTTNDYKP